VTTTCGQPLAAVERRRDGSAVIRCRLPRRVGYALLGAGIRCLPTSDGLVIAGLDAARVAFLLRVSGFRVPPVEDETFPPRLPPVPGRRPGRPRKDPVPS
jgi:hypothetical protein